MKRMKIIGIIGLVLIVLIIGFFFFSRPSEKDLQQMNTAKQPEIEYFEVPDIKQVYINGIVRPVQSEAFAKDTKFTSEPQIQVNNGDIVEAGTILYTYENKEITKQINQENINLEKNQNKRIKAVNKWQRAIDNGATASEEEKKAAEDSLDEEHRSQVEAIDEEIQASNSTINSLAEDQYVATVAKFKGRVSIPEVVDANSPILTLISEGYYVEGFVNEKDLPKISIDQQATIKASANGATVNGKITFINEQPNSEKTAGGENNQGATSGGNNSEGMSKYEVKLSLDSMEGIKNGFHVQGSINLEGMKDVEIPGKALHSKDGKNYVLVNDFGTVARREVQIGASKKDKAVIKSGLESDDRVIVKSPKELKEGDQIDDKPEESVQPN